jgi:hypothetical protein
LCEIIQKNVSFDFISGWMKNIQKIHNSWKSATKKFSKRKISKKQRRFFGGNFSKRKEEEKSLC